nr:MAG TPA: hypothetical protein [Caudoviricetes sp.]
MAQIRKRPANASLRVVMVSAHLSLKANRHSSCHCFMGRD